MDFANSLTLVALWPILIFVAYKFVALNVEHIQGLEEK